MPRKSSVICFAFSGWILVCFCVKGDHDVNVTEREDSVRVTIDGALFTEYHFADADRPYFYPVIAPTGETITRHWPMQDINEDEERDHPHHRSLWFTHGDVNGHDFWTEGKGPKIVQTLLETGSEKGAGFIVTESEWRAKDGSIVCTDRRKHTLATAGEDRIIDFEITIMASHGRVVFGDTKEGSMAFRVAPTLRTKGKVAAGEIRNSEGVGGASAWGKRARWCDYSGPVKGKTVGIALMDHPQNPRHPAWWHARDYGLCAANPFGQSAFENKAPGSGDLELAAGESLTFRYRVLIHNGTAADAGVETAYKHFVEDEK
ncbi:MAG: PmoA family protein [Verrucomicrobia bacterium]|nr:PmoA family protein [Verrucomicrobiota bacterium]